MSFEHLSNQELLAQCSLLLLEKKCTEELCKIEKGHPLNDPLSITQPIRECINAVFHNNMHQEIARLHAEILDLLARIEANGDERDPPASILPDGSSPPPKTPSFSPIAA